MIGFNTNIYVSEERFNQLKQCGFDSSLGMYFWNIAVMYAPYDTGNLRSSIKLIRNTKKHIRIGYDLSTANYAKFLEMGVGPVKKYKGFASTQTRGELYEQLVGWVLTGKNPTFTTKPFVALKMSSNQPFSWERTVLRQMNKGKNSIDAKTRNTISQIRDFNYRKSMGESGTSRIEGKKVTTRKLVG